MGDLPTGTVSFLFSDIEGSTRTLQAVGQHEYLALIERHNQLVRDIVGNAVVSTEGDSFFCVFESPVEAVLSAASIQRQVQRTDWGPDTTLRVRIGLNTGEGTLGGDNYVGLDVHRAARIASAANGGQVYLSGTTHALVERDLPDDVAMDDLGEHRLKDLSAPEHLYQLILEGVPTESAPPNSEDVARSRLPEYLTGFVGREREITNVVESLRTARLVTLTGIGGAGKTRVAVESARRVEQEWPGGVHFAALEDATDMNSAAKVLADAMSVTEKVEQPIADTLFDQLSRRKALLILDNCEHIADDMAVLAEDLLRHCPDIRFLATSREALRISGEIVVRLGPMQMSLDDPLESEAVKLFVARAAATDAGFDVQKWRTESIEICRRLDGIPLAIELAAARVANLTPAEILARLENRFSILSNRARTSAGRHETLKTAIDWSYDLLDQPLQRVFRSLGVFRGGFTTQAVAAVSFHDPQDEDLMLDQLSELSDKSLLSRHLDGPGLRFKLLETVRDYAQLRLEELGEYDEVRTRHLDYFTTLAKTQRGLLLGPDQLDALDFLEADHENLRAVIRRSMARGNMDRAADVVAQLTWFWYLHAHFSDGEQWSGQLLEALPDDPERSWLHLLLGAALYDFRVGAYDRAEQRLTQVQRIANAQDLPQYQMWAYAYMATNDVYGMRLERAIESAGLATGFAMDLADSFGLTYATYIGVSAEAGLLRTRSEQEADYALVLLDRLRPVNATVLAFGERNMIGHVLQTQAILTLQLDDIAGAAAAFDTSIAMFAELGQIGCACHCLEAVASFLATQGDHQAAADLIGATDHLRDSVGIRLGAFEETFRSETLAMLGASNEDSIVGESRSGPIVSLSEASHVTRERLARF